MSSKRAYLDIHIGDAAAQSAASASYSATCALLTKNAAIYGLPSKPEDLDDEQQEILQDLDKSASLVFAPPSPLLAGRLLFALSPLPGLGKTTSNFTALCTGARGACKAAPTKKLHYLDVPVHRIVPGFVAQGGDVTRETAAAASIFGPKFNDEKPGFALRPARGSLCMVNSGKNSNSSQWFVVLGADPAMLDKLKGKYVVFGALEDGWDVLDRLDAVGSADGTPKERVWVGGCGVTE